MSSSSLAFTTFVVPSFAAVVRRRPGAGIIHSTARSYYNCSFLRLRNNNHRHLYYYLSRTSSSISCCDSRDGGRWQHQQQNRFHYSYDGPGRYHDHDTTKQKRNFRQRGYTVGIGGPVGSGKTALVLSICQYLTTTSTSSNKDSAVQDGVNPQHHPPNCTTTNLAVVTNDIFTQEDAEFLTRHNALPENRIRAVETGGCPHAAIREDISANLSQLEILTKLHNDNDNPILLLCESGGDNLAANFSNELADLTLYVIDVSGGDKIPRKGGPGITQSDLLVINKIDLANAVNADLNVMEYDANRMRTTTTRTTHSSHNRNKDNNNNDDDDEKEEKIGRTIFASVKHGKGVPEICQFILDHFHKAVVS